MGVGLAGWPTAEQFSRPGQAFFVEPAFGKPIAFGLRPDTVEQGLIFGAEAARRGALPVASMNAAELQAARNAIGRMDHMDGEVA